MPTIADATGAIPKEKTTWDGLNLIPLLAQKKSIPDRSLYWHYPHYGNQGGRPGGAIRNGSWKLIEWYDDTSRELYDLQSDLSEKENLALSHPDRVSDLSKLLADWRQSVGAVMPSPNPRFDSGKPEDR